jgi:hypothetical protein
MSTSRCPFCGRVLDEVPDGVSGGEPCPVCRGAVEAAPQKQPEAFPRAGVVEEPATSDPPAGSGPAVLVPDLTAHAERLIIDEPGKRTRRIHFVFGCVFLLVSVVVLVDGVPTQFQGGVGKALGYIVAVLLAGSLAGFASAIIFAIAVRPWSNITAAEEMRRRMKGKGDEIDKDEEVEEPRSARPPDDHREGIVASNPNLREKDD